MSRVKLGKILPSKGSSCDPKQKKTHNLSVIMVIWRTEHGHISQKYDVQWSEGEKITQWIHYKLLLICVQLSPVTKSNQFFALHGQTQIIPAGRGMLDRLVLMVMLSYLLFPGGLFE